MARNGREPEECVAAQDALAPFDAAAREIIGRLGAVTVMLLGRTDGQTLLLRTAGTAARLPLWLEDTLAGGLADKLDGPMHSPDGTFVTVPVRDGSDAIGVLVCRWAQGSDNTPTCRGDPLLTGTARTLGPLLAAVLARDAGAQAVAATDLPAIVGASEAMQAVRDAVRRAAASPFPVLIEGESGSGKELVARAVHRLSSRSAGRFVALNCAAVSDELVEAELFGHTRGAFTGAGADRRGLIEEADAGTLFLDEVAELSPRAQAKLLRVIQEGEIRRVGENRVRHVDARVVAASNRSLLGEARAGRFRTDLLYRLDVVRIHVPPLRARLEDLPMLAGHLWREIAGRAGTRAVLGADLVRALARYDWPGNVRELQNVLASVAVSAPRQGIVRADALPARLQEGTGRAPRRLEDARREFDAQYVAAALARAGGRRAVAARELGLTRQGLAKLLARLDLARAPDTRSRDNM